MEKLILIGIPVHGNINPEVVACLISLLAKINYTAKINFQSNCYVHDARNKIVSEAINIGASHLMFIDADTVFPPDGVDTLIERDKDIIGGLYYRRQPPHLPTINQQEGNSLIIPKTWDKSKPFEVFAVATGFMLIKTEVFKKIKPPYFYFGNFHGKAMGEDVYWCWKARRAGFKIWCDPTIELGHIGDYVFGAEDYNAYKEVIDKEPKKEDVFTGEL